MKSLSNLLSLALATSALALPSTPSTLTAANTHTIPLVRRGAATDNLAAADGVADLDAVLAHLAFLEAKYAGADQAADVVEKRATGAGSAALVPSEGGSSWAVEAGFGSSGTTFPMILDTASSDCRVAQAAYDPTKSSTAVNTSTPFSFTYTNGRPTSGTIWRDTLRLAGLSVPSVAVGVSTQTFLSEAAGVCGLAPDGSSAFNNHFHPFFYQMVSSGAVSQPVFSFALSKNAGTVTFGGTPAGAGAVVSAPAVNPVNGFWKLTGSVAGVDNDFVLDSSSNLMVVPLDDAGTYFANLGATTFKKGGALFGSYACAKPPSIVFKFGAASVPVVSSAMSIGKTAAGECILPIVGKQFGLAIPSVGGPLFESALVVFDVKANTVGFAQREG
ncbi:hypothetical protein OC834_006111 [Tilletia horrida]|nr:hypothetical protein OC834_006111 [Tilletia horrida]